MRILLDYRSALRHRTGVGEQAHRLAESLVPLLAPDDALTIFSSSWKDRLPPDAVPGARHVDRRIPVRLLNAAWHRLEAPPVEWLAGPHDVTHSLHPLMVPSHRAARVITIHDLYFLDNQERTSAEIRRDYARLAASHARRADAIVVPSEYTRSQVMARFGVDRSRIAVCSPGAPEWTRRVEPPPGGPILFVGTLEPRKNLAGLLKGYARLVDARPDAPPLVVAGKIPPEYASAAEANVGGRVDYRGYVSDEERLRLYRQASMLMLPSLDEGFGLPALEAMTIGLPVIAANRGSLPEVMAGAGILVEPDDPAAMATAMAHVLSEPATRQRMTEEGVARASTYRWGAMAARVYETFGAAIERRRGTG